ncbi:MAG: hypothetical protein ACTSQJ_09160 [Promethearchaeota archaeon]
MVEAYKSLEVKCPVCEAVKSLNVPEKIFAQKKFGTIKIQVPPGAVCAEHQFIIFVDTKGNIRGYEKIDILMATPTEAAKEEAIDPQRINLKDLIQMYGLYGVFCLMHATVFKYPSYIISSEDCTKLAITLNNIGKRMLPEKYQGENLLHFIQETDYNKIKIKEKKALLMDSQLNILQTPWEEKLKFEEEIIKKALEILDETEQFIIIQQDIAKFIEEAEYVVKILKNVKEIYEDDLIEKMIKDLNIPKINHYRLLIIKEFIKQRIDPKLPSKIKNKVEEFLNLL